MPNPAPDPTRAILTRLHDAMSHWLQAARSTGGGGDELRLSNATVDVVEAGRAFLALPPSQRDELLRRVPRTGLVLLQQFGRAAFRNLIETLLVDREKREKLRNLSSLLLQQFRSMPDFDRSDLYQLGLVKVLASTATRWPDFQDEGDLDAYLTKTLRNILLKRVRGPRRSDDGDEVVAEAPSREMAPATQFELEQALAAAQRDDRELEARLERVQPTHLRAVFLLKLRHDWSYPELARIWPEEREPEDERRTPQGRAKWIEREYKDFLSR